MRIFLKLLRYGSIGILILAAVLGLAVTSCAGWAAWHISHNPEFEGTFTYWDNKGQSGEPLGEIKFSTEEGFPGERMPKEDVRTLLERGEFSGHLELVSTGGFKALTVNLEASASTEDILDTIFAAMMGGSVGEKLAEAIFGEKASITVGELLEQPSQELVNLLGENYEEILLLLSGGDLGVTLGETLTGNLGEKLELLPAETLGTAVDVFLGEQADKTLSQLLEAAPEELEAVLGEEYEAELAELFEGDTEKTLREVLVDDPSGVLEWAQDVLIEGILEGLFGEG